MKPRSTEAAFVLVALVMACFPGGDGGGGDDSTVASGPGSFGSEGGVPTSGGASGSGESGGESSSGDADVTGDASSTSSSTTEIGDSSGGDTTTGEPGMSDDEILFRAAVAGEADPGEALQTISDRGGLPVLTAGGTYLFGCLCGPGSWNLAGMHNGWVDDAMTVTGSLVWAEAEVAAADGSLYKFHDTDQDQWIADPLGRRYGYDDNGRYTLVRASAAHLERWYAVEGDGIGPRDLQVWVPEGGVFTHALYAHDGQNLFDPEAIWGGWKLQASVPDDMLVVGIDNTPARMDEYTHVPDELDGQPLGGLGDVYADYVEQVVRARMEAAYGPADVVGTMGSSLGGLIAFVIADRFPDRYAMAISLSGTMGWGSIGLHNETMIERYADAGKRDFAVYLDSGGAGTCVDSDMDGIDDDGTANDNYCENLQLEGVLLDLGYSEGVDLWYVHDPDGEHNESFWAGRVGVPMAAFAGL